MVLAFGVGGAAAQTAGKMESFVGVVKAVSGSSLTVERGSITGVFNVDASTHIAARGATAKTKEAQAAGKPGAHRPGRRTRGRSGRREVPRDERHHDGVGDSQSGPHRCRPAKK